MPEEEKEIHDYILYKDGEYVNTIVADQDFIDEYTKDMGYTWEIRPPQPEPEPEPPEPPTAPTSEKITALEERQEFLEDCIAEMALQIYN